MPQRSQDGWLVATAVVKRVGRCFGSGARIARATLSPVFMLLFWCVTCLSAVQGFDVSVGIREILVSCDHGTARDLYAGYNKSQVSTFPPQGAQTIDNARFLGNNQDSFPSHLSQPVLNLTHALLDPFALCLSGYPCPTS